MKVAESAIFDADPGRRLPVVVNNDPKSAAYSALAAEIRAERAALGITVKELAIRSGVPYGTLNRLLPGAQDFTFSQMAQIATGLGITPAELSDRAVRRMGGLGALVSEVQAQNVTPLRRVEDLSLEELDEERFAANRDKEAETDEQFD